MDGEIFDLKKWLISKINRKLTFLFIIVALIAPILGIYYFYHISIGSLPEEILSERAPILQTVAALIIICIAIDAGVIGYLVSRSISKPLQELYAATKQVAKGNYKIRLDIQTQDEIAELADAFNQTTAQLGKMQEEKKEIDKAKSEFLSITSHELRSPITPMKAQLQMLEEGYFGKLSKKQKESLCVIVRNADRLDRIISDFLEISRIEAARLKFEFRETDLSKTIKETVDLMDGFAKEKNIKLVTKIEKIPIIEVDPDRVTQILRNLINNAIKFSKEKGNIEISAKQEKNYIHFTVKDYGAGLTPSDQIKIFEPFYQVEDSARRRHGGTGLGLAICRGIVESQKGKIWVESLGPNKGSTFNFTIPTTPVRIVEPIKVLFSEKKIIDRKICDEFRAILGPLGVGEFNELKNKNALNKEDIYGYIDTLTEQYILDEDRNIYFKKQIGEIFGDTKETYNEIKDKCRNEIDKEMLMK